MTYNLNIDDFIGRWGYSKQYIRNQLTGLKNKPVNVRISSLGGSVDDGLDIRQQFIDHGDVTAYLYGCVASSATIVALGANKVCASKYSMFMVHKVSNWIDAWGQYNADQLDALIQELKENKLQNDKYDLVLASMYADKCKKPINEILDILKAGSWLTAQEALKYGFIDEIIEKDDEKFDFAKVESKLNILGFPALPSHHHDDRENSIGNVLHNISVKLDRLISPLKTNAASPSDFTNNIITMKKDYSRVNTILNVEGLEFDNSGKCNLSEDQIKALNEKVTSLEEEVSNQKESLAQKDKQIENLGKKPGDDTIKIEGGERDNKVTATSMYNQIKEYI